MHIVWNLATHSLKGSIVVESVPGSGTAFELRFPAITPE
jgi:chemotaxis protein histidine kinase CheA